VTVQSWWGEFDENYSLARQQKPGQSRIGKNLHGDDFLDTGSAGLCTKTGEMKKAG